MEKYYIAPESKVMEINAEGMLCTSAVFEAKPDKSQGQSSNSIQIWQSQDVAW